MENREWRIEDEGCWDVYPAIDLRGGRVVRLRQGDPDRETEYASDPLSVARRWREAGATWLHVVNLDGALNEGGRENQAALERILTAGLRVQFGGGLRDLASLHRALNLGVSRVVVGTAAVKNPALVNQALRAFGPQHIALGIDAREGQVRTDGWQEAATMTPLELAGRWAARGVRWVIFTDVSRDGMGSGLNLEMTTRLAQVPVPSTSSGRAPSTSGSTSSPHRSGRAPSTSGSTSSPHRSGRAPSTSGSTSSPHRSGRAPAAGPQRRLHVIASGGVASLEDVQRAYQAGLSGVIIGRALYEGQVALEEALQVGGCIGEETKFFVKGTTLAKK